MAEVITDLVHHEYKRGFLSQVESAMAGKSVVIKNPHERMRHAFNMVQSRFLLLGSVSGVGKSAFIDDTVLLKPWRNLQLEPDRDIHFEAMYFSMERKKMFKHAKWASWLLYQEYGHLLSGDALMGWDERGLISKEMYQQLRKHDNEISDILDAFPIYDGRISVAAMTMMIKNKARQLGDLYVSDTVGVRKNGVPTYITMFSKDQVRMTRRGPVQYVLFMHKEQEVMMEPNQKEYFLFNPKTFLQIVLDGAGLITPKEGQSTKQAIDEAVNLLSDARDVYGFSPVMVSQFNRAIADISRQKHHGADLGPEEGDFKDTSNMFQAADVVLALFDPYRAKALNKQGQYLGYDVKHGMITPKGFSRFRSLHILKNSFGFDGAVYGMGFWGEVNHFQLLPKPDSSDLQDIYARVIRGK